MIARKTTRREVRLDLNRIAEEQLSFGGVTFADWVREQIQRAEDYERQQKLRSFEFA